MRPGFISNRTAEKKATAYDENNDDQARSKARIDPSRSPSLSHESRISSPRNGRLEEKPSRVGMVQDLSQTEDTDDLASLFEDDGTEEIFEEKPEACNSIAK